MPCKDMILPLISFGGKLGFSYPHAWVGVGRQCPWLDHEQGGVEHQVHGQEDQDGVEQEVHEEKKVAHAKVQVELDEIAVTQWVACDRWVE